ncbi:Hypothetical predicted protein [Mytilus galloprovincialis]|uniref:Uncharacterized protein n=1 Tax=Mytilus galloprovincialis TaxID=29158 RepID=A0A8B6CVV9_MYTGA|nr:Hypothetical predicted protein [Mytilus galloprovincialis]
MTRDDAVREKATVLTDNGQCCYTTKKDDFSQDVRQQRTRKLDEYNSEVDDASIEEDDDSMKEDDGLRQQWTMLQSKRAMKLDTNGRCFNARRQYLQTIIDDDSMEVDD